MLREINILLTFILTILGASLSAQSQVDYRVFLIGDTGAPELDGSDPVFDNLKKRLDQEGKRSAIVFLGDNIYHNGMPPKSKGEAERKLAEEKILVQLDALKEYKGKVYFIPGNHDWNDASADGIDYIKAQEEFIEFYLDRGDVLLPDHGCPGPEVKKLGKHIVLVAMDSQWWLHPHSDDHLENNDCKNKNTFQIIQELKEILDKHDDKHIIIAFHHPVYSDGSHNGHFSIKDHVFPLSALSDGLLIPLPVLGSLYPFYRSSFGSRQDMAHPLYQDFIDQIKNAVKGYSNIVLASGHEHNLQYFEEEDNHFIKSGSGSKTSALPKLNEALFNSEEKGYAVLEYFENGSTVLKYYTIEGDVEYERFNKEIITKPLAIPDKIESYELPTPETRTSAHAEYMSSGFHRMLFGNLYREDWATDVTVRNINLSTELGGLIPIKAGGGMTSNSLRLEDQNGKQYVLRSVQKSVKKVVPHDFQNTVIERIFQDQIAASQPFAALAVQPLAEAVGVYHTHPEIVYLPKQKALGDFETLYGDELYLFEERPAGDREDEENFGGSKKIISFSKMLKKIHTSSDHHIHQEQVLKSRIFDIFLGDWDRHDDQWRWASFKETHDHGHEDEDKVTFYEPVPRDRDQVFFKYKGFIPWLSKLLSPQLRKFQSFDKTIKKVNYLGFNARHFDRSFLNQMDREDWQIYSDSISLNLTDDVINKSIQRLPTEIQALQGDFYRESLQSRRDLLPGYTNDYYDFLAKYVDVLGTNEQELFEVQRLPYNKTEVKVYEIEDGEKHDEIYSRVFESETKEIRLYGLEGNDEFQIKGEQSKGPMIRVIGGPDRDKIVNESKVRDLRKSTLIYDDFGVNEITFGPDSKDKRSTDYRDNQYDRKEFYYDQSIGFVVATLNPDDGLRLDYLQSLATYGFRKNPFKAKHSYRVRYSTAKQDLGFGYELQLTDVFGNTDFNVTSSLALPSDVENFFGLTNERRVLLDDVPDFDFFRYRQTNFYVNPALQWVSKNQIHNLKFGPYYEYAKLRNDVDRFIFDQERSLLANKEYDTKNYIGLQMDYKLIKTDNAVFPTQGMSFSFQPSYNLNISDSDESFSKIYGSLTVYNYLWVPKPFVLATKLEGGVNIGEFSFYQANYIGRRNGLRAFRQNRFGGKSSFLLSNDLRLKVLTSHNRTLPFSLGLIGSYDYGRVWVENEASDNWHQSYGGGFWISLFDLLPISFYYLTSPEDESSFLVKFGFAF